MDIEADSAKQGLKTVIAELHDSAISPGEEAEQLPLLPLEGVLAGDSAVAARGPGRPPGSRNKNTDEWRNYILSRHRSPLEALAQTYCMPVEELAKKLGLVNKPTFEQALELLKLQLMAAKELAPYVHQKMPMALETGTGGLIQLVINQGNAIAAAGPNAVPQAIEFINIPPDKNQLVTEEDFQKSNETQSNEKA